jgi:hypothetical protein
VMHKEYIKKESLEQAELLGDEFIDEL